MNLQELFEMKIKTHPQLLQALKESMFEHVQSLFKLAEEVHGDIIQIIRDETKDFQGKPSHYHIIATSDASSKSLPSSARVFFCLTECLEWPTNERIFLAPMRIPYNPSISIEEEESYVSRLVDLVRENMRIMAILAYLKMGRKPDLILIDGPINLRRSLAKTDRDLPEYETSLGEYIKSLKQLRDYGFPTIGFVKRSEAKYFIREFFPEIKLNDSALLSLFLNPYQACPWPPRIPVFGKSHPALSHNFPPCPYTYIRTVKHELPFRIEFMPDMSLQCMEHCIEWILGNFNPESGLPYPLEKVDEEVRITRRLIFDLYEDISSKLIPKSTNLHNLLLLRFKER